MINIAIMGFGIVGSGIADVVEHDKKKIEEFIGEKVYVKYILDIRDFPDSPYGKRVVKDLDVITGDESIKVVCETMGRIHPAREFTMKCLEAGKSVVTSNKELVAACGIELMECAKKNDVFYEFEAAVGGGIPEIRSIRTTLAGTEIVHIDGIVNGTTNYILTKMYENGVGYSESLKEAQALGYAEGDPTDDIKGKDAARKIIILAALATGYVFKEDDVHTEGIDGISKEDMDAARKLNMNIKLIASFKMVVDKITAFVCPMLVPNENIIAHVNDVYNAINVETAEIGNDLYYGKGAGKSATAGAVVSDVLAILSGIAGKEKVQDWKECPAEEIADFRKNRFRYYVRLSGMKQTGMEEIKHMCKNAEIISEDKTDIEMITASISESEADAMFRNRKTGKAESVIRLY